MNLPTVYDISQAGCYETFMLTFEVVHFCSILKVLFDTFSIFSFLLTVWWCVEIMQSCIPSIGSVIWIQLYMWWLMYKALSCHWLLCVSSQINLFVRNLYDPNLTWNILTPGSAHRSLLRRWPRAWPDQLLSRLYWHCCVCADRLSSTQKCVCVICRKVAMPSEKGQKV